MNLESILPYLAGPGAGLLICVLIFLGSYKLLVTKVLPLFEGFINRHLQQVDDMNKRHSKEHEAILKRCEQGFERVNTDITKVCTTLDSMAAK